jgi:leucyl/phenylalanyl-tRNA--protein transferase
MRRPYYIPFHAHSNDFPPLEQALEHPDGLLAVGGTLSINRLICAYSQGIFPWYSDDEPILWWAPSQRLVLFPEALKISRSLAKTIRKQKFSVSLDNNFQEVIEACAAPRDNQPGTWITADMQNAYYKLHQHRLAHSVEAWYEGRLVGGLYGVALGKVFFGESMFTRMTDASKVAFVHLVKQLQIWGYELIDCQVYTRHLESLGAVEISRTEFSNLLDCLCKQQGKIGKWEFENENVF